MSSQGMNFLVFREIMGVTGRDDVDPDEKVRGDQEVKVSCSQLCPVPSWIH